MSDYVKPIGGAVKLVKGDALSVAIPLSMGGKVFSLTGNWDNVPGGVVVQGRASVGGGSALWTVSSTGTTNTTMTNAVEAGFLGMWLGSLFTESFALGWHFCQVRANFVASPGIALYGVIGEFKIEVVAPTAVFA